MSNQKDELNSQAVPFFARFLEGQHGEDLSDQESEGVSGGHKGVTNKDKDLIFVTLKYPSDQEEGGLTRKYPSDQEEGDVTKKYPSDSDEEIFVTLKYPSDGDDTF